MINLRAPFIRIVIAAALAGSQATWAQAPGDALERGFQDPPASARPRVWWHWMNGNVTKDGISADFAWMKRVGIGGVQNFDAALATPQVVEKRLAFMTPEWKDAFAHAVSLADTLGLEFAIAGSPGWSESGGPWVTPEHAMKKVVWSETRVEGGKPFTGKLAAPPAAAGPFQGAPRSAAPAGRYQPPAPDFYRDSAVVAFPTPAADVSMAELQPVVSVGGSPIAVSIISDGDFTTAVPLPASPDSRPTALDIDLRASRTVYGLSLALGIFGGIVGGVAFDGPELLASEDGRSFTSLCRVPRGGRLPQYTVSVPAVRARYLRLLFPPPAPVPRPALDPAVQANPQAPPAAQEMVSELAVHTAPRVHRFEDKAGFATTMRLDAHDTPPVPASDVITRDGVVDLTSRLRPDGTLDWNPPPGRWTVLRVGYSLTGKENSPASPEATGLEVDKLNAAAVKAYFTTYLDKYRDASKGLMGKRGLGFIIMDSWEARAQNWTDEMIGEFTRRRGYDMRPWLPALAGRVVQSAEASDRFLWDLRATIGELTVEHHYDQLTTLLRARGMGRYTESHEQRRAFIGDGMDVKRTADVPMSAMWVGRGGPLGVPPQFAADIRESASVAHIYGQNIVAAESLTAAVGAYSYSPENLKATADAELSQGLNRFVIHTSVHQPLSDKPPGQGLGRYGQWFTRLETWAEQAEPWVTYLSRSSYMLQQGRFAADVLYYYGDDSNLTALFGEQAPDIPAGYNFDYANSDVLLNRIAVSNGYLTTATGMKYRVLVLDANTKRMQLPVLRKIRDFVAAGAIVAGPKPVASPRLMDDQREFKSIVDQLWGAGSGVHPAGAGKVYAGGSAADALAGETIVPDFEHTKPQPDTALLFVHRALPDGEVYWVNNRQARVESVEATFRVTGKAPEIWHPDTGLVEPAAYRVQDGRTIVPLRLEVDDAVFVVFRKAAAASSRALPPAADAPLATIDGPWTVSFQAERGAPATAAFPSLTSWSEHADRGIRYFSGTATYAKSVDAPAGWFANGAQLWLDLGDVKNLAEVTVNGRKLPLVWKQPFRVNITGALRPGANAVEIAVTNLWVNRIVGDTQPDAVRKYTSTPMEFYTAASPLLRSGLLGPVRVVVVRAR